MVHYHITQSGDKWKFKKEGNKRSTFIADTKQEVMGKMQQYMANKTGSVKIHKKDGKIQEELTFQEGLILVKVIGN